MLSVDQLLRNNVLSSIEAKQSMLNELGSVETFSNAARYVLQQYRDGGRLYIAGNGGSAADAQHLAAEFVSKLAKDRSPLAAEALTVDTSVLTAIGNDYGYEEVFARQIRGKMTSKDVFLAITTSGQSANIIRALEECRSIGITSILFTGHDGGSARDIADYCIVVPGDSTATIQEIHILLAHTLCEYVELSLFG
jgi:D-sedoheptulose 7-phosphate isomerase